MTIHAVRDWFNQLPARKKGVVVTALLSVCFIFPFSFQSPAGLRPCNKKAFPRLGERLYFVDQIYTPPFSRYLLRTTSSRVMTIIFE